MGPNAADMVWVAPEAASERWNDFLRSRRILGIQIRVSSAEWERLNRLNRKELAVILASFPATDGLYTIIQIEEGANQRQLYIWV